MGVSSLFQITIVLILKKKKKKKKKGSMALGGAAWRNETRAWRRAMLKTPRPNTANYS